MEQRHNINEEYDHYVRRKHGVSTSLFASGILSVCFGVIVFQQAGHYNNSSLMLYGAGGIILGVLLFYFGVGRRKRESTKNYSA